MTKGNNLISTISGFISGGLSEAGMQKRKGDIFTLELAVGIIGWVGLNRVFMRKEKTLEINPVIGVRHQQTEELLASLLDEDFHPYVPPTISISLGYVTPERRFRSWLFKPESDQDVVAESLVSKIVEFGYPFMAEHSSLPAIIEAMEASMGVPSEIAYRLPVAYFISGDPQKSETYLANKCAELGNAANPYSLRYQTFASRFRDERLNEITAHRPA
jgi:hypothetical protein